MRLISFRAIRAIYSGAGGTRLPKASALLTDEESFWGKRFHDFFEARITSQRVPIGKKS